MNPRDRHLANLQDDINQLTTNHTHAENYRIHNGKKTETRRHLTTAHALIDQLETVLEPGSTTDGNQRPFASSPAARIEAVDLLLRIDGGTVRWLNRADVPQRDTLPDTVRALLAVATTLPLNPDCGRPDDNGHRHRCRTCLNDLTRDVHSWATAARIITGWEVPAFRPNSTCPLCGVRGSLRVRIGDGITSTEAAGYCTTCGETWDHHTIGILAAHIRAENGDEPLTAAS